MHPAEILWTALIGFVVVGTVGYFLSLYNGFVEMKNNIGRSWANVDVLLKQRHDELPKLVKTCEARAALAGARTVGERAVAESQIGRALGGIMAVAESYPDLKADQGFRSLQQRISEIENQIADRREFYNDVVTLYNTRLESIPDSWIAQGMNLSAAELFKIQDREREDPKIEFRMSA